MWQGIEHWWNRVVYQHKSRDIWLWTDGERWLVQSRLGTAPPKSERFDDEPAARAYVARLKRAAPADTQWRQMRMPEHPVS